MILEPLGYYAQSMQGWSSSRFGQRGVDFMENCAERIKHTRVFDLREKTNPVSIATFPVPSEREYCQRPGKFGPHNLYENRQGTSQSSEIIFATYQNAGVRFFNIANPFRPEEVAGSFRQPRTTGRLPRA